MIRLIESIVGVSQSWQQLEVCILCRIEIEAVHDQHYGREIVDYTINNELGAFGASLISTMSCPSCFFHPSWDPT